MISNQGAGGYTAIAARNDINLGTVRESTTMMAMGNDMASVLSMSSELGSTIATNGTTLLNAGRDVNARQATVDAGQGLLSVQAGRDIHIESGEARRSGAYTASWTDKGLLKSTTTQVSGQFDNSTSIGSSFSGGVVAMGAGNNLVIEGAHVSGTQGVMLSAGNQLTIVEGRSTSSASGDFDRKRSSPIFDPAFMQNKASGTGIDIGSDTAVLSTISSSQGGVVLRGGAVNLQGVQVSAAKDIAMKAAR
ncbi:hemagglutinin repeat-containing protein [Variovorax sp. DT-64]|uniref:hemagglutinin repeat-containing protein n=1 Tax=Variovorax sp. DT-64 TaxID=3396160 RepID=UPI003F1A79DA